jgi:hypothetical protein
MGCERMEDGVRAAGGVGGFEQVAVEAHYGAAQGANFFFNAAHGAPGIFFLEFGDGFEVAEGFGFDGLGLIGIEDGVEFLLLFKKGAHGLGVVEGEVAFLEAGV